MKLATYTTSSSPDRARVGVLTTDRMLDAAEAVRIGLSSSIRFESMKQLLALGDVGLEAIAHVAREASKTDSTAYASALHKLEDVRFLPPIPDSGKFLCVGKNYRNHLAELQRTGLIKELPEEPTGFIKLNNCLVGHDANVERPTTVTHLDYEPELVFVIGKPAFHVGREQALEYVAGITILNDLTCRDTQKREVNSGTKFWTAKNAPGLGPFIITMDEVKDPYDIWVTCTVNGNTRMRVNTSEQIWKLADIIHHFSRLMPLEPGDMFSTGAPGGVAVGKPDAPSLFLKPGDVVECAFENPAMVLRTHIVAPQ